MTSTSRTDDVELDEAGRVRSMTEAMKGVEKSNNRRFVITSISVGITVVTLLVLLVLTLNNLQNENDKLKNEFALATVRLAEVETLVTKGDSDGGGSPFVKLKNDVEDLKVVTGLTDSPGDSTTISDLAGRVNANEEKIALFEGGDTARFRAFLDVEIDKLPDAFGYASESNDVDSALLPLVSVLEDTKAITDDLMTFTSQTAIQAAIDAVAITDANLADGVISGSKLTPATVGTAQLANNAVTNAKISSGAVNADSIGEDSITADALSPMVEGDISDGVAARIVTDALGSLGSNSTILSAITDAIDSSYGVWVASNDPEVLLSGGLHPVNFSNNGRVLARHSMTSTQNIVDFRILDVEVSSVAPSTSAAFFLRIGQHGVDAPFIIPDFGHTFAITECSGVGVSATATSNFVYTAEGFPGRMGEVKIIASNNADGETGGPMFGSNLLDFVGQCVWAA